MQSCQPSLKFTYIGYKGISCIKFWKERNELWVGHQNGILCVFNKYASIETPFCKLRANIVAIKAHDSAITFIKMVPALGPSLPAETNRRQLKDSDSEEENQGLTENKPNSVSCDMIVVTGSQDKTVKFWNAPKDWLEWRRFAKEKLQKSKEEEENKEKQKRQEQEKKKLEETNKLQAEEEKRNIEVQEKAKRKEERKKKKAAEEELAKQQLEAKKLENSKIEIEDKPEAQIVPNITKEASKTEVSEISESQVTEKPKKSKKKKPEPKEEEPEQEPEEVVAQEPKKKNPNANLFEEDLQDDNAFN